MNCECHELNQRIQYLASHATNDYIVSRTTCYDRDVQSRSGMHFPQLGCVRCRRWSGAGVGVGMLSGIP